jgi:hypothetical protein
MAAPAARPWLSWLWSSADSQRREWEQYKSLKLRKSILADDNSGVRVSPDLLGIEELIQLHGENLTVMAWACFALNPAPHCKPPRNDDGPNPEATMYPVTVFLKHFDSYMDDAKAEWEKFKVERARPVEQQQFSEVVWLIKHFHEAHPKKWASHREGGA